MTPTLRDYLTISFSLAIIFACGFGIGHLVGARQQPAPAPAPTAVSWQDATLARLDAALLLNNTQREAVRRELETSGQSIDAVRARVRDDYRRELLDLHDRISPVLDDAQRQRLEKSRQALQLPGD